MRPLLLAALLAAAPTVAEATRGLPAQEQPAALELIAPTGETWSGGESVEIGWRLRGGSAPSDFEEWEVFLSVDGGRSWPVRLTPHLGRAVARYRAVVPNLPSNDVRLLLRFGDEREERDALHAARFAIRPGRGAEPLPPRRVFTRGESARAGGAAVLRWEEGDRSGARVRSVESMAGGAGLRSQPVFVEDSHDCACEEGAHDGVVLEPPVRGARCAPHAVCSIASGFFGSARAPRDPLALLRRRNT